MAEYDIPPELLDAVLAVAGRFEDAKPEASPVAVSTKQSTKTPAGVWLFQANPRIYNIDQALS